MPAYSPDFSKGFIYCLKAPGATEVYYGSCTTNPVTRWSQHQNHFRRWCAGLDQKYLRSFDVLLNAGAYLEVLEEFPCSSSLELHKREGEWISQDANAVNRCVAGRTRKEYQQLPEVKERECLRARKRYAAAGADEKKAYYRANRERILARAKALRDAGKAALQQNKEITS